MIDVLGSKPVDITVLDPTHPNYKKHEIYMEQDEAINILSTLNLKNLKFKSRNIIRLHKLTAAIKVNNS